METRGNESRARSCFLRWRFPSGEGREPFPHRRDLGEPDGTGGFAVQRPL